MVQSIRVLSGIYGCGFDWVDRGAYTPQLTVDQDELGKHLVAL
jgi:hypothetical protein